MRGRWINLFALAGLWGCGPNSIAGGGSDQPNKIQAGRILTTSGAPAVGARVVSWRGQWDPEYSNASGEVFDSSLTDSVGGWSLKVPAKGQWYVMARSKGFRAVSLPGDSVARLAAEAFVEGLVLANHELSVEAVWIGGREPFKLRRLADSSAEFSDSVLPGPGRIWAKIRWRGGSDTVLLCERVFVPGDSNPKLVLEPDTGNVLLASADAVPARSALRGLDYDPHDLDAARWYTTTDQVWGGSSILAPLGYLDEDSAVRTDSFGRYFSWNLQLGPPLTLPNGKSIDPWAGVGIRLSHRDLNWSGVRFLRLWVKGSNTASTIVWMQVNSSVVDRIGGNGQLRAAVVLPSGWSFMNVPVGAFAPPPGSKADSLKIDWNRIKGSIREVVFFAQSPEVRLDLKEIRAIGNRLQHW